MVVPSEHVLAELRTRIKQAIEDGSDGERKALLQALVQEVSVTSRDHIEPFFRVPQISDASAVRTLSGLVDLGCHYANTPTVAAHPILLSPPNTVLRLGEGNR